ncbi:hypothetical protein V5799_027331 [Amblyomma americanum]|uniref:Uncharacterized protein n=1 Tax=Amblyomma americanum TaxID=6943 RepID=A0AAQ4DG06_AMBAM
MQRTNAREGRGRLSAMRQTTLPYRGRPSAMPRAQSQQPPYRAPAPPPQVTRASSARGRGSNAAAGGGPSPRPGILKKPAPKLQQEQPPQHQPRPALPSWRPTAPDQRSRASGNTSQVTFAAPIPSYSKRGNLAGKAQPVPAQQRPSGISQRSAQNGATAEPVETDGANMNEASTSYRILSVGVASIKGTGGICEVFGTLDSVPTTSRRGLAKHFTLRQDRSSVNCVFYQMDRPLGPLIKGTLLRCVGFMNRAGQLSVVSARPATGEEKKFLNVVTTVAAV